MKSMEKLNEVLGMGFMALLIYELMKQDAMPPAERTLNYPDAIDAISYGPPTKESALAELLRG